MLVEQRAKLRGVYVLLLSCLHYGIGRLRASAHEAAGTAAGALLILASLFPSVAAATFDGAGDWRASPIVEALRQLGTPYRYGGASPREGFDCSGLVLHAYYRAWGVRLPRRTAEQRRLGKAIRAIDLQPGDLVFYNTRGRAYSHVGIYVGHGHFVHAPRSGQTVRMEKMDTSYWRPRFNGARRLAPPAQS
jgi:cell wall-associated NlpC family hydrolase